MLTLTTEDFARFALAFVAGALLAGLVFSIVLRRRAVSAARQLERLGAEKHELATTLAVTTATLDSERGAAADKLKLLEAAREELSLRFRQLSQEILEEKSKRFTEHNREQMELLLTPLRERIGEFEKQVKQTYEYETRDRLALKSEILNLQKLSLQVSTDANKLAVALRGETRTQGAWGEMILERIFELSGLTRGREYETQLSVNAEGGRRRPDAVVHLPDGRDVIIDAKVSLTAFARLGDSTDEAAQRQCLAEHVLSLRNHIKGLSVKEYHGLPGIESLDFVLMFVPSEAAYIEALRAAPELYEEALIRNIALVSPSTLLPTLRTVENLWKIERQGRNAQKIAEEAGKLYDQFVLFEEALSEIGARLGQAQDAYDTARRRLVEGRGNLVRRTEQLKAMGARASKALPHALVQSSDPDEADSDDTEPAP